MLSAFSPDAYCSKPFRLLTTEAASNPQASWLAGLQSLGLNEGPVFIDTNVLYDLGFTENLGAKYVRPIDSQTAVTVGARYFYFIGSSFLESAVKARQSRVDQFRLTFSGPLGYAGVTRQTDFADYHFNFQYADVSGSKVLGAVFAASVPFAEVWCGIGEAGYDFENRQPRASLGVERNGDSFGLRFGLTYLHIDDSLIRYTGVAPVIDFFWLMGKPKSASPTEAAPVTQPAESPSK
jgi:hypothetical protein